VSLFLEVDPLRNTQKIYIPLDNRKRKSFEYFPKKNIKKYTGN
jgi:hypothetical protein